LQTTSVPIPSTQSAAEGNDPDASPKASPVSATNPGKEGKPPGKSPDKLIDEPQPPIPPSKQFEHDMMVRFHMHGSLDLLRAIERLLIRGKLDESRTFARMIAEAPFEPDLGPWAAQAAIVRERASAVASAPGLDEACRREARLAEACAD